MIYLLDVSLLIALIDQNHIHHARSGDWFKRNGHLGWATCPITENGFLRILSSSAYPVEFDKPGQLLRLLREFCAHKNHRFWPDDFSLLELAETSIELSLKSRHVTDLYLLALAIRHGGGLATLDQRIPADNLVGGSGRMLVVR